MVNVRKRYLSVFQREKELKELIKDGEELGFSETLMGIYRSQLEIVQREIKSIKKINQMVIKQLQQKQ